MKKLEELFNVDPSQVKPLVTQEEFDILEDRAKQVIQIEEIISEPQNIQQHEKEMDDFSKRALEEYDRLIDIAQNMEERHAAPVFQTAVTMFKNAMDAKISKANLKLKAADLLMKKQKMEQSKNKDQEPVENNKLAMNRNAILRVISDDNQEPTDE